MVRLLMILLLAPVIGYSQIGAWSFNGNSNDASGNGYNGSDANVSYVQGKMASSASFNGSSSKITIGALGSANPTAYTVSLWFKINGAGNSGKVYWTLFIRAENSGNGYNHQVHLRVQSDYKLCYQWGNGISTEKQMATTATYNDGFWHHCAAVHDGTTGKLYVDGALVDSYDLAFYRNTSQICFFGDWPSPGYGDYFNGLIDHVLFFPTAWGAGKVKNEYSKGKLR